LNTFKSISPIQTQEPRMILFRKKVSKQINFPKKSSGQVPKTQTRFFPNSVFSQLNHLLREKNRLEYSISKKKAKNQFVFEFNGSAKLDFKF
jgi:hypothetical protein